MMFCISVVIDGSAELAHSSSDYWHLNSLGDCSKRLWLSTRLTKYWHFACRSETIFRLQSSAYFTTRLQNVNISLYLIHFIESCWELRRAGPRQGDFLQDVLQGPGKGISCRRRNSQHDWMKCNMYNEILKFCHGVMKSEVRCSRNIVSDMNAKC